MRKLRLVIFLCISSPAIFAQSDLRLFGTNLFDFSPLTSANVNVPYHLQGKVSHIYSSSIRITCDVGIGFVYSPPPWGEIQNSTPGDLLSQLYVQQRAEKGDIGVGEMLSMGPNARQYLKPVEKTVDFYLLNYPFETQVGANVDCFALPTTTNNLWDYGKPFSGNLSQFKVIYRIQPTGIIAEHQYSPKEKEAMKQAIDARTVAWLFSQATNGSASAQCSLGLHYLSGQGVETNKALAIEWLKRAAGQGDIEASNKIEKLTTARILNQN